jgi:hypothetical protein
VIVTLLDVDDDYFGELASAQSGSVRVGSTGDAPLLLLCAMVILL